MSDEQTTLNLDNIDLAEFNQLDVPMSAEDVLREQKKTKLSATMSQAIIQNPTQEAKVRDLSRRSGIPQPAVEADIPSVESHLKLKNINLDSMVKTHPVTSDYLSQYSNAAIAHNDIDTLKSLEQLITEDEAAAPDYKMFNTLRGLGSRVTDLLGSLASGISQAGTAIEESMPMGGFTMVGGMPMYLPPEQWTALRKSGAVKDGVAAAGEVLKEQDFGYIPRATWDSTKSAFSDGLLSGTGEALSFGVEQGVISLADMVATVYAMPAYIFARSEEMGQERAKNKGMAQGTIKETMEAAPFAVGSAILERILPEKVFGGMSKTEIEKVGKEILEGATSKVKEVLTRATDGLITEASTEAVQEGIIEYLGEKYGTDADINIMDMLDRGLGGAVGGGIAGSGIAGGIEAVNVNRQQIEDFYSRYLTRKLDAVNKEQVRLEIKGVREQRSIDGINEYSANSELRKLDPESFRQFIDQADGDKDLSVFIDGVQTKLYVSQFQGSTDPVIQMLQDKVTEAAALGSDVAVPIGDFATLMAGTEHFAALREFMTLSGETTAPFRQQQQMEESQNYIKALMAEAGESTSQYVEAQDIYNTVREQLIDTGVVSPQNAAVMSQLVPAWATVFAQRNGISIQEAYDRSGLIIEGPQTGEAARLANEAEQLTQMENQQAIAKGLDMSQEARMQRAKDMGFDTENVFFHGTKSDISAFDSSKTQTRDAGYIGEGVYLTGKTSLANFYAGSAKTEGDAGANVMPVLTRVQNTKVYSIADKAKFAWGIKSSPQRAVELTETLKSGGYDSAMVVDSQGEVVEMVVFDPSQIRSVNASFDPEFKASPELLAQTTGPVKLEGFDNVDAQTFADRATAALANNPNGKSATIHGVDEYAGMNLYTMDEGRAGFAIENGMLVSVFKDPSSNVKGAMGTLIPAAIKAGANQLEAFDGFLTEQYAKYGFVEVDRIKWDDAYAPDGWDTQTQGRPDVVVMKLKENQNGNEKSTAAPAESFQQPERVRSGDGEVRGRLQALENAPSVEGINGPIEGLVRVAEQYAIDNGIDLKRQGEYVDVDPERATRIAQAYEQMENAPNDPVVREAYENLIEQTKAQYQALVDAGYQFWFVDLSRDDNLEYISSPWNSMRDIAQNKQMGVFPTDSGFGSDEAFDPSKNPLLADTGIKWPSGDLTGEMKTVYANDLFRAVHDAFGHGLEGAGFRAVGEENAWQAHVRLFTGSAIGAITSETRGQNSWVNYGPSGEQNRTASAEDTVFADQKVGIMPEWTWTEGRASDMANQGDAAPRKIQESDAATIKTGEPVTFKFSHNTESATKMFGKPKKDSQFGRYYEPSGRYVSIVSGDYQSKSPNIITGELTLRNPLVVDNNSLKWKENLSKKYDGKRGKALSNAVIADGYDGIITTEGDRYISEIVDFTTFDEAKALYQNQGVTRGYYSPSESMIRLTEAADLSTFLHEFAHFMYEMELTNGKASPDSMNTLSSIHNWYKRNAEDVAKEANGYLVQQGPFNQQAKNVYTEIRKAEEAVSTAQSNLDHRIQKFGEDHKLTRVGVKSLQREAEKLTKLKKETSGFREWFSGSKAVDDKGEPLVVYHGTFRDVSEFRRGAYGRAMWTSTSSVADTYAGEVTGANLIPVYVSAKNPLVYDAENSDWQNLYFEGEHTTTDTLADIAESRGFDSLIIHNLRDENTDSGGFDPQTHYAVFKPNQLKSAIGNSGAYSASTGDLLNQDSIPAKQQGTVTSDDVIAYLDSGTAGDKERDDAIRRAVHEQFARGFETYLMEGKAPSIELRNAFRTFARWLTEIYRAIRGQLKVNLDAEMRKVFDRLLATEDQINAAEARAQYTPMFTDAAMAGMTEQEFADYKLKQSKVKDKQTETLREKLIAEITRQSTKWWKDELADEVDIQIEELKKERVYRAREALKEGKIKLDHATVKEIIGENVTNKKGIESRRIPTKLNGMTIKGAQGVHPDEAAALLGYGSGDELLIDLLDAVSINEKAEAQAELEMITRHGDILHDGTIEQQADEALLNEERGALILQELKALSKGNKAPAVDRGMLKSMAEENIAKLAYRDIHPDKYRKAELRAAQEAAVALSAGNKEQAAGLKLKQAMNFYLHKAAVEARNDTMKIVERMARYNTKTVREAVMKAENGYWEQIVKILSRFEFRKSASLRGVDQRNQDINSWVKERIEIDGDALILTPEVLDELFTTHWKNVPYDKLKGINDSVRNIEHVARYSNKIKTMGEEIDFKKLVNRWVTHMQGATISKFKSQRTDAAEGRNWGRMAMAQMTKIPFLASWLDGGERGGMSHDILVQPFTDAQAAEVNLWTEVGQPVMDLIENRSKEDIKRHNKKVFIRELVDENNNGNLYGNQILAVALNTGNAGNLRKMLLGEGWANAEDESTVSMSNPKLQAILSRMTKADWDLVQTIWDRMELLYPQLAEVHRRTTGLVPPKVEAVPVQTPYGEYKGGYYPLKYDPNRSQRAQDNEDKLNAQVDSMFSNSSSIQASVTAGATNERTKYYAPIRLSLDVVPAHFQEAIHFITHHDAVRQANKIIRNPEVTKVIREKMGPEEYAQLRPWLNDIAKDGRESNTKLWWEDMIGRLRFGITLGSMGFKASTGIMQLLGLSNIAAEVGPKYAYRAFREILGSPATMQNAWDFASSNSKILNNRVNNMDREIKNAMSRINSQINIKSGSKVKDIFYRFDNSNVLKTVQEASMKHIAYIQTYVVDLPTWYAAYIKELESSGDEAKAYRVADTTVEMIQGSGATKDLATIMRTRNETTRMLTMFMTFFSSLWNMNRDLVKGAKSGIYSPTTTAAKLMFLITVPVALEMLMRGEFEDDDEDEDTRLQKMLTKTAMYPVASLPFVRDIASGLVGDYGYNMSPVASLVEQGTNSIPEMLRRPFTDEEITKGQAKGASKFVGAALGIPATGQIWATGEHLYKVLAEGEDLTGREILFGPDRK
jgi:hypothetical protein